MRRFPILIWLLTSAMALVPAAASERVDGIAATVDGRAVMQSDVQEQLAYECFLRQQSCAAGGAGERRAALDRIIDQQLIVQEMERTHFGRQPSAAPALLLDLRRQLISGQGNAAWQQLLVRYGLSEAVVSQRLAFEADTLRFTDARFRPAVRISAPAIERYYKEEFLPRLGTVMPPQLPAVAGKIQELLIQQAITEQVSRWLLELRQHSRIEVR